MPIAALLLLAVGLAADSCAVAAARGMSRAHRRWDEILATSLVFGLFQGGMPVLGWWLGVATDRWFHAFDHWIAFGLLTAIGLHMIHEAFTPPTARPARRMGPVTEVVLLAVATSIDALVAGVSLPLLGMPLAVAAPAIAAVTFALSICGFVVGHRIGARFGSAVEIVGGMMLIALGVATVLGASA